MNSDSNTHSGLGPEVSRRYPDRAFLDSKRQKQQTNQIPPSDFSSDQILSSSGFSVNPYTTLLSSATASSQLPSDTTTSFPPSNFDQEVGSVNSLAQLERLLNRKRAILEQFIKNQPTSLNINLSNNSTTNLKTKCIEIQYFVKELKRSHLLVKLKESGANDRNHVFARISEIEALLDELSKKKPRMTSLLEVGPVPSYQYVPYEARDGYVYPPENFALSEIAPSYEEMHKRISMIHAKLGAFFLQDRFTSKAKRKIKRQVARLSESLVLELAENYSTSEVSEAFISLRRIFDHALYGRVTRKFTSESHKKKISEFQAKKRLEAELEAAVETLGRSCGGGAVSTRILEFLARLGKRCIFDEEAADESEGVLLDDEEVALWVRVWRRAARDACLFLSRYFCVSPSGRSFFNKPFPDQISLSDKVNMRTMETEGDREINMPGFFSSDVARALDCIIYLFLISIYLKFYSETSKENDKSA